MQQINPHWNLDFIPIEIYGGWKWAILKMASKLGTSKMTQNASKNGTPIHTRSVLNTVVERRCQPVGEVLARAEPRVGVADKEIYFDNSANWSTSRGSGFSHLILWLFFGSGVVHLQLAVILWLFFGKNNWNRNLSDSKPSCCSKCAQILTFSWWIAGSESNPFSS